MARPPGQDVEDVCFGSGLGPSSKRANEVRTALLLAGFPNHVPAYTVNRWARGGMLEEVFEAAGRRRLVAPSSPNNSKVQQLCDWPRLC